MLKNCLKRSAHGVTDVKSGVLEGKATLSTRLGQVRHYWLHEDILGCLHLTQLYKLPTRKTLFEVWRKGQQRSPISLNNLQRRGAGSGLQSAGP